jgi:anti-sigma regulatory factor (Ser/Thr protein kinase)
VTVMRQNTVLQRERRDALERERLALERERDASDRQRLVLREVLASVTDNRLRLCDDQADLPPILKPIGNPVILSAVDVRTLREDARKAALDADFSLERCFDLMTAVSEAAMNAVVHAGGGEGRVSVDAEATVQVRVQDLGSGIAVERLPKATLLRGHSTAGTLGHGFWLILNTVDRLWLLTGDTGTTVVLEQDRIPSDAAWLEA